MKCPRCQRENPTGMKFCGECGARQAVICPACGTSNAGSQKFCGECAGSLTGRAPAERAEPPETYIQSKLAWAETVRRDCAGASLDDILEECERRMILDALGRAGGVQARAAKVLGISERSLWYRVKKLKIPARPGEEEMTCPACGEEEHQDRRTMLADTRPLTLHRECPSGHSWHMPLVIKPETRPGPCDCDPGA